MALMWALPIYFLGLQLTQGTIDNVATNKPTDMSSSHRNEFSSGAAVDGNRSTIIHTALHQDSAWWKVDLQRSVQDATVTIYFRTDNSDRRDGVKLYTSSASFTSYPGDQLCDTFTGSAEAVVSTNCTGTWQYLLIYRNTRNSNDTVAGPLLDFAEVEVLVCSVGTYGTNCMKSCTSRQCVDASSPCDRYTGACSSQGCKAGWQRTDCTENCTAGTYGPNCNMYCVSRQCVDTSSSCDRFTGACSSAGCTAGYQGADCTQACTSGTYGDKCNKTCVSRHCAVTPTSCQHITGACPPGGCNAGWTGDDCFQVCSTDTYGASCQRSCISRHCVVKSSSCDRFTGVCPGECEAGWQGPDCTTECISGTYGNNCMMSCSDRKCRTSSSPCDREIGQCPDGCLDGWKGTDCTNQCPSGRFGQNCMSCSERHCQGESDCPGDGTCSGGCQDGWTLNSCSQACPGGTYGPGCSSICGKCTLGTICYHETGNCPGDCKPGWQGSLCKEICPRGMYGINCKETCGNCNGTCDVVDGHCPGGCLEGYCGTQCRNKLTGESTTLTPVTGAVIGAAAMLAVVAGILLCLVRCGRLKWVPGTRAEDKIQTTEMADVSRPPALGKDDKKKTTFVSGNDNDYAVLELSATQESPQYDGMSKKYYENL